MLLMHIERLATIILQHLRHLPSQAMWWSWTCYQKKNYRTFPFEVSYHAISKSG